MPSARKTQICLNDTPYYHCISRCVRRAWLCGNDVLTGHSYEHRRAWVEKRLHFLAGIFAIDVCAYAVMSNHTHVVLHIDKPLADTLTTMAVLQRWHRLYKGTLLSAKYLCPQQRRSLSQAEVATVEATAGIWRERLADISWFMRALNEYIARQANQEDECTGRFWEGRFKSQALLSDTALLACMAYVDLNPVRAGIASTPAASLYTSIRHRLRHSHRQRPVAPLMAFNDQTTLCPSRSCIPFSFTDYLVLINTTGRIKVKGKSCLSDTLAPLLHQLGLKPEQWLALTQGFEQCFHRAAGDIESLLRYRNNHNLSRIADRRNAQRLLG